MLNKKEYFPRKTMFEEVQELVASFLTSGDYFVDFDDQTGSKLANKELEEYNQFYTYLFAMSFLYNCSKIKKILDRIMKSLKSQRKTIDYQSEEDIIGELDIDKYILLNKIEAREIRIYPTKLRVSTFQMPEYQFTLRVVEHLISIIIKCDTQIRNDIKDNQKYNKSIVKQKLDKNFIFLSTIKSILKNKFGVKVSQKESYAHLHKMVMYRYRNRKIITNEYKDLHSICKSMMALNGVSDMLAENIEMYLFNENFDDRLFEIWCLDRVSKEIETNCKITKITRSPLHLCNEEPIIKLENDKHEYLVWFQNRVKVLNFENVKWFYKNSSGEERKLDAIPDIIIVVKDKNTGAEYKKIIIDAKNREWTLDSIGILKDEVTHLIFIRDNFEDDFNKFIGVLIAHNDIGHKELVFNRKESEDEVRVISINVNNIDEQESFRSIIEYLN